MTPAGPLFADAGESSFDPDVTWVGPNAFSSGLCLGFDDGTIAFADIETGEKSKHQKISASKEAINGLAVFGNTNLAASTRADVTFFQVGNVTPVRVHVGAHGIVATNSGYFVAPLGANGLLWAKFNGGRPPKISVSEGLEDQLYFYRTIALHDSAGKETLVFANRRNGVGLSNFSGMDGGGHIHTVSFEGFDVIDVCGVVPGSLAAVAISPKAELFWIKDSSTQDDPVSMRLNGIEGRVCRVLATRKDLFVLSSKALYVWQDLVTKALFDSAVVPHPHPFVLPMEAVDMCLYNDNCLVLVLAVNGLIKVELSDLEKQMNDQVSVTRLFRGTDPPSFLSSSRLFEILTGRHTNAFELSRKTEAVAFMPHLERGNVWPALVEKN